MSLACKGLAMCSDDEMSTRDHLHLSVNKACRRSGILHILMFIMYSQAGKCFIQSYINNQVSYLFQIEFLFIIRMIKAFVPIENATWPQTSTRIFPALYAYKHQHIMAICAVKKQKDESMPNVWVQLWWNHNALLQKHSATHFMSVGNHKRLYVNH